MQDVASIVATNSILNSLDAEQASLASSLVLAAELKHFEVTSAVQEQTQANAAEPVQSTHLQFKGKQNFLYLLICNSAFVHLPPIRLFVRSFVRSFALIRGRL